jgi:ubiquinone/menaquinone biosynthesis C-methylase UbiE
LLPKPAHLGPAYAAQFQDRSVAQAYAARPPYPAEFFDIVAELLPPARPRRILELGCGTGDVTLGLIGRAERIDAIDPSAAMLDIARSRPRADDSSIRWIEATAEQANFDGPYSLAVAAESLHWMEWSIVLPKVAAALAPGAFLVLAERGQANPLPWDDDLARLIATYSTNREFQSYDLVSELTTRGLFREVGRRTTTTPTPFRQSIEAHIESLHSRNGFSRQRMSAEFAAEFDALYRQLLERHCDGGVVHLLTVVTVIRGVPAVASTS